MINKKEEGSHAMNDSKSRIRISGLENLYSKLRNDDVNNINELSKSVEKKHAMGTLVG